VSNRRPWLNSADVSSDYIGICLCYYGCRHFTPTKEAATMNSVTTSWRERRQAVRTRRALDKALARTSSPAMRDELLVMASNSHLLGRR
jgi:hypothetical protein